MTFENLQQLISRITYKPNIHIGAWRSSHCDGINFIIGGLQPDASKKDDLVMVKVDGILLEGALKGMDEKQVIHFIKTLIKNYESHEISEWLKIDGIHETNPHPESPLVPVMNSLSVFLP